MDHVSGDSCEEDDKPRHASYFCFAPDPRSSAALYSCIRTSKNRRNVHGWRASSRAKPVVDDVLHRLACLGRGMVAHLLFSDGHLAHTRDEQEVDSFCVRVREGGVDGARSDVLGSRQGKFTIMPWRQIFCVFLHVSLSKRGSLVVRKVSWTYCGKKSEGTG